MTLDKDWADGIVIGAFIFWGSWAGRSAAGPRHYDLLQTNLKLDAILAHLGIDPPSSNQELDALIVSGRKINAIKLYRELHRTGLKESKDAVEQRERELLRKG